MIDLYAESWRERRHRTIMEMMESAS